MGKCSKCGKNIEYNNYKVISGLVYCPDCTPEKAIDMKAEEEATEQFLKNREDCTEIDPESLEAEKEAQEQFEKDMAEVGETIETARNEISEILSDTIKDSGVNLDELANALNTVNKKPRKRRSRK